MPEKFISFFFFFSNIVCFKTNGFNYDYGFFFEKKVIPNFFRSVNHLFSLIK